MLGDALGVGVEVELQPIYVGQPLFTEVDGLLRRHHFELFDLVPCRWRRRLLPETGEACEGRRGQVVWAQALYFRDGAEEAGAACWAAARVLKLASLFEVHGLPDCAAELLQATSGRQLKAEAVALLSALLMPPDHRRRVAEARLVGGTRSVLGACCPLSSAAGSADGSRSCRRAG